MIFALAIVVISFTAIQLIVASANLILKPVLRDEGHQDYLISVLIPARNEEKNIAACVRSLLAQDYPDFDVYVLDDHSEDATRGILDEIALSHAGLHVIAGIMAVSVLLPILVSPPNAEQR